MGGNKNPIFIDICFHIVLVIFLIVLTNYLTKINLREKGFILAYSARQFLPSTMVRNHLKDTAVNIPSAARKQSEQEDNQTKL